MSVKRPQTEFTHEPQEKGVEKNTYVESVTYQKSKELEKRSTLTPPKNIGYDIH